MIFDLHSHTTYSDGVLEPKELVSRALEKGVDVLSITDHDTIDAYQDLAVGHANIRIIPGIEFSTQWQNTGIHVLGLNVDVGSDALEAGTRYQAVARQSRAVMIGENLAKKGIKDAFAGASKLAKGNYIGRPHFARHLVNIGKVNSIQSAFKKYLGAGKTGDVKQHWVDLSKIIGWIRGANGIAVLAHPLKYKMTNSKLKRLLDDFLQLGGEGVEVVSGQQLPHQTQYMARLCEQKNLLASCGSDFHVPNKHWAELGAFSPLPRNVTPVWDRF